ncbi:putative calcium-binding protein CML30 [Iris pallida]|uniref:Calcium-binding protein CML30 n=1 Tax=Iris pallida TaxID=29817 RepID=A0AAX6GPX8_IRIPA|nr:putative calcium-binding protein CML30 [Iris pallida]
MEKTPARSLYQCFSLVEAVGYLVLDYILFWACRLQKLSASSSRTQATHSKKTNTTTAATTATGEGEGKPEAIRREDVEMVMERIGMSPSHEGEKLKACMAFDDLSNMFEEEEPSLEEVKEVFGVFDENCDGFIDASELHRVLGKLGFDDGADLDACRLMIAAHDQDLDGTIDFNGFVRFMESIV